MKQFGVLCVLFCSTLLSVEKASAVPMVSLDFVGPAKIHSGDTFAYQLNLTGLDPNRPNEDLLAAFSADMTFNSTIVSFQGVRFSGLLLGDPSTESVTFVDTPTPNSVSFGQVSLLEQDPSTCIFCVPPYLAELQRSPPLTGSALEDLRLAAIVFRAETNGVSPFNLFNVVFSDPAGGQLYSDLTNGLVVREQIRVPEPSGIALFAFGLAALAFMAWRQYSFAQRTPTFSLG